MISRSRQLTVYCIVEAIQITLEENIAQFDKTVVRQCDGTAMGSHHACSYADIAADLAKLLLIKMLWILVTTLILSV